MDCTAGERKAYIRGALSACLAAKATPEVTMAVCRDLKILPEELDAFAEAGKTPSFVPGVLGEVKR
jgi:hypothetical protein